MVCEPVTSRDSVCIGHGPPEATLQDNRRPERRTLSAPVSESQGR
jgi:hypothetical protein